MAGSSGVFKSYDHAMYGSAVVINLGSLWFGIRVVKGVVALYVSPRGREPEKSWLATRHGR
jgi:hypothetical protein